MKNSTETLKVKSAEFPITDLANSQAIFAGACRCRARGNRNPNPSKNQVKLHQCTNQQNQLISARYLRPAQAQAAA